MSTPKFGILVSGLAIVGAATWGCSSTVQYKKSTTPVVVEKTRPGPPPHAPAHGYRCKHTDGVVLVYDSRIGVYVATDYTGVYFYEGSYYRLSAGEWQFSSRVDGKWKKASEKKLPPGLHDKQVSKAKSKGNKS